MALHDDDAWTHPQALLAAWAQLQAKHKAGEFDLEALRRIGSNPSGACAAMSAALRAGQWRQQPLQPFRVPKRSGGQRVLMVPGIADRLVHAALATWISDRVDSDLAAASHAYRPGRGVHTAAAAVREAIDGGARHAWRADIQSFFDSIDHARLVAELQRRGLWANRHAAVLRQLLRSQVHPLPGDGDEAFAALCLYRGLPQGSPLSPVLSNIVLDPLDRAVAETGATMVRYADDFVVLADTRVHCELAADKAVAVLSELGLRVNNEKTLWLEPGDVIAFLGRSIHIQAAAPATAPAALAIPVPGTSSALPTGAPPAAVEQPRDLAAPLLRTLYLLQDHTVLGRDGNSLLVQAPGQPPQRIPSARVGQVLAFGATTFSSGAIGLCLEQSIPVMLLSGRGRHFGVIDPMVFPHAPLLKAQLDAADDLDRALAVSRSLVAAKIANTLLVVRRWARRHTNERLQAVERQLADARRRVENVETKESLRGVEGAAAAAAFGALASMLPAAWHFGGRHRRPPPDPVNSLLSYGYTLLYYNTLTLVLGRGLHPHVGLYHAQKSGHHALVSDLMEPFRPLVVDALVADLLLNGGAKPEQFNWPEQPGEPCLMSVEVRSKLIHGFEAKMNTRIELRTMDVRLDMRRIIDMQALMLADYLLGRSAAFAAFTAR